MPATEIANFFPGKFFPIPFQNSPSPLLVTPVSPSYLPNPPSPPGATSRSINQRILRLRQQRDALKLNGTNLPSTGDATGTKRKRPTTDATAGGVIDPISSSSNLLPADDKEAGAEDEGSSLDDVESGEEGDDAQGSKKKARVGEDEELKSGKGKGKAKK